MRVEVAVTLDSLDKALLAAILAAGGPYRMREGDHLDIARLRAFELVRVHHEHDTATLTFHGKMIARRIVAQKEKGNGN